MEKTRNLSDGLLAKAAIVGLGVLGAAASDLELAATFPNSVAAERDAPARTAEPFAIGSTVLPWAVETAPAADASDLKQECIDAGLAKPEVLNNPTMRRAGIRPLDPRHFHTQQIWGTFEYPAAPCPENLVRISGGQLQMQKRNNRAVWINIPVRDKWNNPLYYGNQEGRTQLNYGPTHAWPDYLFNECTDGKFQKVRDIIRNRIKDMQTGEFVSNTKEYILPVKVSGSCKEASASEQATKNLQATWGQ